MINWTLKTWAIKDLKPHGKNPRKLSKEAHQQIVESMDKYGLIDKPIVNTDGSIIGGHQRIKILKQNKAKDVECWIPDQTLNQRSIDELCIRLNRNHGDFDFDMLANQWETGDLLEWGFSLADLDLGQVAENEDPDENDLEVAEVAKTKIGDLYELGDHRLICGDSTSQDCVTTVLNGNIPILMVTDPPYGVSYDAEWRNKEINKQHTSRIGRVDNDDRVDWSMTWKLLPGCVAYVWHAAIFCSESCRTLVECDYKIISNIIWAKQHFAISRGDYHWQHESCWYAVKNGHKHNWQGARDQSTLWSIANLNSFGKNEEDDRTNHSTQKPLQCMARPILNNTAEGEGVYDPFVGSGTTLLAAEQYNRKCYAIEINPTYCDMTVDRWVKYRNKIGKDADVKLNGVSILWTTN